MRTAAALAQADWAARMESLDWQSLISIQSGGIEARPGSLGRFKFWSRPFTCAFALRSPAPVRRRLPHGQDDVRTLSSPQRTSHRGCQSGRALGGAPLGSMPSEKWCNSRKCPNLYWALTDLPSPLVDLRRGVQGERTMIAAELR